MSHFAKQWALITYVITFMLLAAAFFIFLPRLMPPKRIYAKDISDYLEDGDIICRLGDRLWSQYFKDISITDKRYSHLGIVKINDNGITVINAEGLAIQGKDFVNETDLDDFLEIAKTIGIYRLKDFDGKIISSAAMEYIGYPFDWYFDLEDDSKIYCTELLYIVLKKIAPEIELSRVYQKEIKKDLIPLEAVSNSDYFAEILHISVR